MIVTVKQKDDGLDLITCHIPKSIFDSCKLSKNTVYTFHFGQQTCNAFVEPCTEGLDMYFPINILETLLLPCEVTINWWTKKRHIHLGPVVAIFVNTHFLSKLARNVAPLSASLNAEAAIESNCLVFYFSVDSIDWISNRIMGWVFIPKDRCWKKNWFPLPNVFYDKGVSFKAKQKPLAKAIRKKVDKHPGIKLINSKHYLGKWQLFKRLNKYPEVKGYIPETLQFQNFQVVEELINKVGLIFLKSYYGSRGSEVMAIEKDIELYRVFFKKNEGLKKVVLRDQEELKGFIERFFEDEKFIVQQGVKVLTYNSRPMDMRILIQKNSSGRWTSIYNQVNISPGRFPITNNERSDVANYEDVYSYLKREAKNINIPTDSKFREVTINIASYIEKEFGPFGEIGMDMALDQDGRIWLIEANAKPEKEPIRLLEKNEGICPQFLEIFNYAKFLAGVR